MRATPTGQPRVAATDLASFVACRHRTGLDLAVALQLMPRPDWSNPASAALIERGRRHEEQYVAHLRQGHRTVRDLGDAADRAGRTLDALRQGIDVVVQGELASDGWHGYPDLLVRVEVPSALGAWSYEVHDTKLARDTQGSTILQLAVYSELLGAIQGLRPQRFCVVTPDPASPVRAFRLDDYAAYCRLMRSRLAQTIARHPHDILAETYPEPVEHCDICRWEAQCARRRRVDDHLSLVAGATRLHRAELESHGVRTLAAAARLTLPVPFTPARGARETYAAVREQARVQFEQRTRGEPVWELLAPPCAGLLRMPEPSAGDIFLDLEGARFAREGGREYLFGLLSHTGYRCWWATTDAEERAAFEAVMDAFANAWARDPGMHVYHFGHYEVSALKRLAGRHASRTDVLDNLLRAERFVDLHRVTRQTLRAGVESYSIKQLEQYYGYRRQADLVDSAAWLHAAEVELETEGPASITPQIKEHVEAYNADDCRSTQALRDWLEGAVRQAAVARGDDLPRPVPADAGASDELGEREARVEALRARLLDGFDADAADPAHPQHPRWLLAYLIDWHRREERVAWWEYLRVLDLDEVDELLDAPCAIAGLEFVERVAVVRHKRTGKPTGSAIDRYRYPPQEVDVGGRGDLYRHGESPFGVRFGTVEKHDRDARTLDIKVSHDSTPPDVLFSNTVVQTKVLQEAVMRLAETPDARTCGLELLYRRPPRFRSAGATEPAVTLPLDPHQDPEEAAVRLAQRLDRSWLAVQGPPGAGKTYAGARMIRALVRAGKRVGVTAVSHKVICNLLEEVARQAGKDGESVALARKAGDSDEPSDEVRVITDNDEAIAEISDGSVQVLGGTAWLWAREDAADAVDVLFVDEAGQMSLANVLAVSRAAGSIVLLGDPQQLEQPQQGSHPDGVGISALEHVIGGAQTMPPERGIFLPRTWRLAPRVCRFTSEVFYEGKLASHEDVRQQRLIGAAPFEGAGLWYVPVQHAGNRNWSPEEVRAVERLVDCLLAPASCWVDRGGLTRPLTAPDVLVVAPYNAQVSRLAAVLAARGVRVGTVDKFQGQEAPVVVYSMATSSQDDAPRGMEFLYSLNRLNVATSRARCAAIVVASPALFEPQCRTPRQMQLANALCRFRELAREVAWA